MGWLLSIVIVAGVWSFLKRIGDRYQQADWGSPGLNRLDGINRWFCKKFHRLQAEPIPLPATGGVVLASNHISGLDPMLIIASCSRPIRFVVAREEYNRWFLKWFFVRLQLIPVDRDKRPEQAFYVARRALEEGEVVAIFPQGGIEISTTPTRKLKRGAVFLAELCNTPLVLCRLEGVRGRGRTFLSLVLRSHARIFSHSAISVKAQSSKLSLDKIERFIYKFD